ncbi:MAG: dipeptidase [Chloroflexi bacterium]|nr:dipeptidase [Chloroflexota bacterium]MCC6894391.1 dipeptidase [Anaerolineae bacterium]
MTTAHEYAKANSQQFEAQLVDLLRIKSISTLPECKDDVQQAAEWVAADMRRIGLTTVEILPTGGHPVVYGEWLGAGEGAKTLLVYGHYDVQPAVKADGWDNEPFDPVIHDGKIWARGSSDDKGQMLAHLKATEALLANGGKLPINIKFLIEGEEEIGSKNLGKFVVENRDKLKADVCVISDSGMKTIDQPVIDYSTRGLMYLDFEVQGPKQDLHSGGYGGIVHNPAQAMAEILAQLHNPDGSVNVPGFYDDVLMMSAEERAELRKHAPPQATWEAATGVPQFWGEADYDLHERIGGRPTLEINGFASGFYGEGSKTVLPAKALAKISCRLVPNQDPARIFELVKAQLLKLTPPTVRSEVHLQASAFPAVMDTHSPAMTAASKAYEQGWGKSPIYERGGGTLPIIADFQRQLGNLPVILMGIGLVSDGAHGPNENFTLEMFHKGIDTAIYFYEELGK